VQVSRRYTRGFQYGVAYTYSKTFDYANDDSADVNAGRPYKAFNYGPADFDQTHIFTINYIYDLPKLSRHWDNKVARLLLDNYEISGTTSYASGKPKVFGTGTGLNWTYSGGSYTISSGQTYLSTGQPCAPGFALQAGSSTTCQWTGISDFTGGDATTRPVLLCDPHQATGGADSTGLQFAINPACFGKPLAQGAIGNLARNFVRMPSTFNSDIAIFKNVKIGERREIQLRWEVYNIFNHVNISDINGSMTFAPDASVVALPSSGVCPNGSVLAYAAAGANPARCASATIGQVFQTNASFGLPRAARSPRVMQASIRLNF